MTAEEFLALSGQGGTLPYIGMPALIRLVRAGLGLEQLVDFSRFDMRDPVMLMRLSMAFQLLGNGDMALEVQGQALKLQTCYRLAPAGAPCIRLLAILKPGYYKDNTPVEFLLEHAGVAIDFLYVADDLPWPAILPEHDVAFVAIAQVDKNRALLDRVGGLLRASSRPALNLPAADFSLERENLSRRLLGIPGIELPVSRDIDRAGLTAIAAGQRPLAALLGQGDFPVIVRPSDSQAGVGLARIADAAGIAAYLAERTEAVFCIAPFIDYRSADGCYRKCRVALIGGKPLVCHYAISDHWMVHYQTAGMEGSAARRDEEADFMRRSERDFCRRHGAAFAAMAERIGLDYVVIDCAETVDGRLLFFEADNIAIAHAMDNVELYPYKQAQMAKVFEAFYDLLLVSRGRSSI